MKKKVLMGYIKTQESFIKLVKVMKANEAPEKIWVHELSAKELNVPLKEYHIEYTRTDAFIEKARKWFEKQNEWRDINGIKHCDMESFEDFRKYTEGE